MIGAILANIAFATFISAVPPDSMVHGRCWQTSEVMERHQNPHRPADNQLEYWANDRISDQIEARWLVVQIGGMSEIGQLAVRTIEFSKSVDKQSYGIYLLDADGCMIAATIAPFRMISPILYMFGQLRYAGHFERLMMNSEDPEGTTIVIDPDEDEKPAKAPAPDAPTIDAALGVSPWA